MHISVSVRSVVNRADLLAGQLHVRKHSISAEYTYDPRMLVFEFMRSITLRAQQVKLVDNFMHALKDEHLKAVEEGQTDTGHYLAHQVSSSSFI